MDSLVLAQDKNAGAERAEHGGRRRRLARLGRAREEGGPRARRRAEPRRRRRGRRRGLRVETLPNQHGLPVVPVHLSAGTRDCTFTAMYYLLVKYFSDEILVKFRCKQP